MRAGNFTSRIVDKWEVKDPTTWVFNLKKGVKRSNGEEVTSADILHSINRAKNDAQSRQKHNVRYIASAEAPDAYTVVMKTTEPLATLLDFLRQLIITSKAQHDALGEKADREAPLGFGPYRIRQLSVDNFVALEKVAGHSEVKPENPDEVIFRIQKEAESRVTALLNGEIQIAQFIPPQLVGPRRGRQKREAGLGGIDRDHVPGHEPQAKAVGQKGSASGFGLCD